RKKDRLTGRYPSRSFQDGRAQRPDPAARLRRDRHRAALPCGRRETRYEIHFVVDVDAGHAGGKSFELDLRLARLEDDKYQVGPLKLRLRALDAHALHNVG